MSTCDDATSLDRFSPGLARLLKEGQTAADVADHCNRRGIIIRRCDDIKGLGEKYIRFAFMNPKQNDLMVNTILEIV